MLDNGCSIDVHRMMHAMILVAYVAANNGSG